MGEMTERVERRRPVERIALVAAVSLALLVGFVPPSFAARAPADIGAVHRVVTPSWWRGGPCDPGKSPGSHPIGAAWDGLVACGPGPTQGGSDHLVDFYPGSWGEFEWECVELSMRWMYLAWGVDPYPADGWDVVSGYNADKASFDPDGPDLVVVRNGTAGAVPQPGDVVSVGRSQDEPLGHTAVVTANAVNGEGTGGITLIQQNGGPGNDGWVTYPVNNWVVGDNVTGWLHNPSWTFQWPVVGFTRSSGFEARVAAPGNAYGTVAEDASSIATAGDTGADGGNGHALYGYVAQDGDFYVKRASSAAWTLAAKNATSIALATTASGAPVLAFLDRTGDFFAEMGSLTGPFTLEARGVGSIALADSGGAAQPLLGYVQTKSDAFFVRTGITAGRWSIAEPSGVRSIVLAKGAAASSGVMGYVSTGGSFFVKEGSPAGPWTREVRRVTAVSLAAVGPAGTPLLGYLASGVFYAGKGVASPGWVREASGVAAIAVASGATSTAMPILGYVTRAGDLEMRQGQLAGPFSLQGHGVTSFAISSLADS